VVATTATRERVRNDIVRLVHRGLDLHEFSQAVTRALNTAVPSEGTCLLTMDPATLLPTGSAVENGLPLAAMGRLSEIEVREPDYNKFTALARAVVPAASLSEVTAGDLDQSLRQRELRRPSGFDDELRVVLADATGTWGALTLLREARRPTFTPAEVRFVASLSAPLADGMRRAILLGDIEGGTDDDAGLLVLAPDDTVELANPAARRWLDELGSEAHDTSLPIVVQAVAARTRHTAADDDDGGPPLEDSPSEHSAERMARARVRTTSGRWVVIRGSLLGRGAEPKVAIMLEAARSPELAPLIADAYGLTHRERMVIELVARGFPTSEIAERLHLSTYTVQDHLKAIFEKSGTSSRGDLVARLFFDHYAPRLN
jgi:DNA-binding CsgD family transcriptional regulator